MEESKLAVDLTQADTIKTIYQDEFLPRLETDRKQWLDDYTRFIEEIRQASVETLASSEFQERLWEDPKSITGAGMCSVSMENVINNPETARWVAELRDRELPSQGPQRTETLKKIHEELLAKVKPLTKRMPWLKVARLLAAIYPKDISCMVDQNKAKQLVRALYGKVERGATDIVSLNAQLYKRLNEVLGDTGNEPRDIVIRSMFLWDLFVEATESNEAEVGETEGDLPGQTTLTFLPNERRLKGVRMISGNVDSVLKVLDFVQNGATVQETREFCQQENPNIKENTAKNQLGLIRHTLGLLRLDGSTLRPSALGQQLLDSSDPTVLIPRLLTHIIGFDVILFYLNQKSPLERSDLYELLMAHYPRWTTNYSPSILVTWAENFGMVRIEDGQVTLTDVGEEYANQITVKPEPIPIDPIDPIESGSDGPTSDLNKDFSPPTLEDILKTFKQWPYVFPETLVSQMHVALHVHPHKHFVLLSGLSGTGKTELAKLYAHAYHGIALDEKNPYFLCEPVQPDWTDPTGLLGYINPLQETVTYMETRFLRFLIRAAMMPDRPHFVCLDEMNLARVEYYFAPFLSAMETAGKIVIHQNDEAVDTIESSIEWPKNLFIIGTVNMDETTYAFSDKVLDRAFTLEFWEVDLDAFIERFTQSNGEYPAEVLSHAHGILKKLKELLEPAHLHFGYRTAKEILDFMGTNHRDGAGIMTLEQALDFAIMMKVLPKLRGQDSPEFRECLTALAKYLNEQSFTTSAVKTKSMLRELEATGTTRFWR